MFDPEKFGTAMGLAIRDATAPLLKRIDELEAQIAKMPVVQKDDPGVIKQLVAEAVAALPVPVDGKDGEPGPKGCDGKDGEPGRDGTNGSDGKSITVDDVAPVLESAVNKWALEFERRGQDLIQKHLDRIRQPDNGKDGKDGKDGRDGLGFDDLQVEFDGAKTVTFKLVRGDVTKEFNLVLPIIMDRGVYRDGEKYLAGDGMTWAGSYWIAQKDNPTGKPGEPGSDGFRLAVKRGRDGKDGRNGIDKTTPVKL